MNTLAAARARPRHLVLGTLVAGLIAGGQAPALVPGLAVAAPVLARRVGLGLALAAAALGGGVIARARLEALDRTALAPWLGHSVTVRATLLEDPRPRRFGARTAIVDLTTGPGAGERVYLRAPRGVAWPPVVVGAELAVAGGLRRLGPFEQFLRLRNVHAVLSARTLAATGRRRHGPAGAVDGIRGHADRALAQGLPPPLSALWRGMTLGQDDGLPDSMRNDFRATGLTHLVAASGQNVMLLSVLALTAGTLLGLGLRGRLALVLALIVLYVPLAGGGPSIIRAGVMGGAGTVAALAGRVSSRWYALLLAAACTLTLNPRAVDDPGWQLSFAAVVALLVLATPLRQHLAARGLPVGLADATAITTAATLATAPLIAAHFGRASLVSLPANVLAAPAVAPIMWLGMLAAAAGQASPVLAVPLSALAAYPLAYLAWLAHVAARLPGASVAAPAVAVLGVCALGAALIVSARARRWAPLIALTALACWLALASPAGAMGSGERVATRPDPARGRRTRDGTDVSTGPARTGARRAARLDSRQCPSSRPPTSFAATTTAGSPSVARACARSPRRRAAPAVSRSSTATPLRRATSPPR
jgi:competence protein ComEC